MALIKTFSTVGGLTMVSRVLGFVRDMLMARYLGAGLAADAFFVAFKLPNFFRRLFAEGAFSAAFVPIFSGILGRDSSAAGRCEARRFAEQALAVLLPVLLVFTAAMQAGMPWVMLALTGGFRDAGPDKFALAVDLARLTFPYLMLISLVSLFAGVLNGLGKFAAAAAAPILLNICLVGALLLFHDGQIATARALATAVSVAGLAQMLWLAAAAARAGMPLRLPRPRLSPRVRELGRVMLPVALGAGAVQLNLLIDIFLASRFLPEGSISFLFYADRLNQLPIGVIGVAVGTVLLPTLSRDLAAGQDARAAGSQNRAIEFALLLTLPAAAALMAVPGALIGGLFQHGAFSAADTAATAAALMAYAAGLPAYVLIKVLTPAFYARKDTATPVRVALIALAVNVVLNVALMIPLQHVGLALATALAAWVNAGLLYVLLARRGLFAADARLKRRLVRMGLATAAMVGAVVAAAGALDPLFTGAAGARALALAGLVVSGLVVYGLAAPLLGAVRVGEARALVRRGSRA